MNNGYGMPARSTHEIDGRTYLTLRHASDILSPLIADTTLYSWASRGHTPWGLALDVVRQPILTHAKGYKPITKKNIRLLLSGASTLMLKRLLQDHRRNPNRPMKLTNAELADLRAATQQQHPR